MKRSFSLSLLALTLAAALSACGGGGGGDGENNNLPDTTPPSIVSTTPADGATKVGVLSNIQVVLSEDIDPATVTTSYFPSRPIRRSSTMSVPRQMSPSRL